MSSKLLQFSPQGNSGSIRVTPSSELWNSAGDIGFLQSWFAHNCCDDEESRGKLNWGAVSGLALSLCVSGAFWAGLVFLAERVWK